MKVPDPVPIKIIGNFPLTKERVTFFSKKSHRIKS